MMYDKEDFFSPEMVDERLELSLLQREASADGSDVAGSDPNLLLISDLRYLYGAEGTENVRSLQRVWEHLKEEHAKKTATAPGVEPERHLRLLKPGDKELGREVKRRSRRLPGRTLAALAAVLFLVIMLGSLLTIVHLTRLSQLGGGKGPATAAPSSTASVQATAIPGYTYPPPGQDIAHSASTTGPVYALAWSPGGNRLALSTQNGVAIWNVASNHYQTLMGAAQAGSGIKALAWSSDGRYLAVGSTPLVQIYDLATGKVLTYSADYPYLPVSSQATLVTALAWSPDSSMLAVATRHAGGTCFVVIWNIQTGAGVSTFRGQGSASGISSVSWSGDNRYVASTDGQTVQAWDIHNGYVFFQKTLTAPTNVAWSPSAGFLAFVNHNMTQIWNVWATASTSPVSSYPATNGVLSWDPKGQYLATASGNVVFIVDASTGTRIYAYTGNTHYVSALAWSPDGHALASGDGGTSAPNYVRVWSA